MCIFDRRAEAADSNGNTVAVPNGGDGPVEGGLLPLVRIGGRLYVLENCLHFFPAALASGTGPASRGGRKWWPIAAPPEIY